MCTRAAKYEIQKPSTCRATLFGSVQGLGRWFAFFNLRDQLVLQQNHLLQVEESCFKK